MIRPQDETPPADYAADQATGAGADDASGQMLHSIALLMIGAVIGAALTWWSLI
jgi:hypothetical protein